MSLQDNIALARSVTQTGQFQFQVPQINFGYGLKKKNQSNYLEIDSDELDVPRIKTLDTTVPQIDLKTPELYQKSDFSKIDFTKPEIPLNNKTTTDIEKPEVAVHPETPKSQGGFKNFMKNNGAMIGQVADIANNLSDSLFGAKMGLDGPNAGTTQAIDSAYNAASDMAMKINPMVGGIMKAAGFVGNTLNKVGGGTDGMTKGDAILNSAPMTLMTLGLNGFLGSKTDTITKNEDAFAEVGSSYGGTGSVVDDALTKAGKKYGLISGGAKSDANALISEAKRQQNLMTNIASTATDRINLQSSMSAINGNRTAFNLSGGYQQNAIRAGKYGMLIQRANNILEKPIEEYIEAEPIKESEDLFEGFVYQPVKFQKGGSFNIIPEGALHARKHNIDLEGITQKGIPVVSESEDGKIEQQAEIEHSEIIYRISVTEKIEKLKKQFDSDEFTQKEKDQFAIEAGKLITKETLYNTKDNTNLLNNE